MTSHTLTQAHQPDAAQGSAYVRFEDMETEFWVTKAIGKVLDILSFPWLWVAVGIAAICSLSIG